MKNCVAVSLQTSFFERTPYKLRTTAEGLVFTPTRKICSTLSIPAADIVSVVFYEKRLKLEIEAKGTTEMYFANESDWLNAMKLLKETLGVRIVCEMN